MVTRIISPAFGEPYVKATLVQEKWKLRFTIVLLARPGARGLGRSGCETAETITPLFQHSCPYVQEPGVYALNN